MTLKSLRANLQQARTKAKWPALVSSFVLFCYSFIFELTLADYSPMVGSPKENSILPGVIYRLSLALDGAFYYLIAQGYNDWLYNPLLYQLCQ